MKSIAVLLSVAAGLTACQAPQKQSTGLVQVHDLLGQIERVHVECQLSKASMRAALTKLHVIGKPGFEGDALLAYNEFLVAFRESEEREQTLLVSSNAMKESAEPFFSKWTRNLRAYSNVDLRLRSRARLAETRDRFENIVSNLEPTHAEFAELNDSLRDQALFLGQDFNASSLAEIVDQVQMATVIATHLDARFEECLLATREYVEATALPNAPEEPATEEGEGEAAEAEDETAPAADEGDQPEAESK